MPGAAGDTGTHAPIPIDHLAADQYLACPALHEHHVNDVVVNLQAPVCIPMNEPEAV
jgi:hypothetical protein